MIIDIALLALGIFLLIKGSDFFVDSGSKIGKILRISEMLVGMTVVSFGTSLPELLVAINGGQTENNGVVLGNIIGTNIFNTCVILAIVCIFRPIKFLKETVRKDMYMGLLSATALLVLMWDEVIDGASVNMLSRSDGIILLLFFAIFMYYSLYNFIVSKAEKATDEEDLILNTIDKYGLIKNLLLMLLGVVMVIFGGDVAVDAVVALAEKLNISETFISIMVLAIGTSLPEIFTSIAAVRKGNHDIAIGNLIGSNIFNILLVLGVSSTIFPIALPMKSLLVDIILFVLVCLILILFARNKGKYEMSKLEGVCLLAIYAIYAAFVIVRR